MKLKFKSHLIYTPISILPSTFMDRSQSTLKRVSIPIPSLQFKRDFTPHHPKMKLHTHHQIHTQEKDNWGALKDNHLCTFETVV